MIINSLKKFLSLESASGILIFIAAILAMIIENSSFQNLYSILLETPVAIQIGEFNIAKPLLLWINDGLMAIFFFLIGLEIKREILDGTLSDTSNVILPIAAAIGGMGFPAIIYAAINWGDPVAIKGWAIPSATDIAFALGVLTLFGSRIPRSLKLFLMTLAIIDDLGAIIIIAIFYTDDLSTYSLLLALLAIILLTLLNRKNVLKLTPYILIGILLWIAVLKSGVHATLAGVITAFFIPFKKRPRSKKTQLEKLMSDLEPSVVFVILPLFAFANAGISLQGITLESFTHPIPLGIATGLFFGNQIGIFGISYLLIKFKISKMPRGSNWLQLYGVSLICGIGFTMSLFISSLAFGQEELDFAINDRLAIIVGSLISAIIGFIVLHIASKKDSVEVQNTNLET